MLVFIAAEAREFDGLLRRAQRSSLVRHTGSRQQRRTGAQHFRRDENITRFERRIQRATEAVTHHRADRLRYSRYSGSNAR